MDVSENFGLDRSVLEQRVAFLEDYAERNLERSPEGVPWPNPAERREGIVASALLDAAETALLFDIDRARSLGMAAAKHYLSIAMPMGSMLVGLFAGRTGSRKELFGGKLGDWLLYLEETWRVEEQIEDLGPRRAEGAEGAKLYERLEELGKSRPTPLEYVPQQAILALAATLHPDVTREFRTVLTACSKHLAGFETLPCGPSGAPLRLHLGLLDKLLDAARAKERLRLDRRILGRLETLFAYQAASLAQARSNHYLWRQALSPVSFVDLPALATGVALWRAASPDKEHEDTTRRAFADGVERRIELRTREEAPFILAMLQMTEALAGEWPP